MLRPVPTVLLAMLAVAPAAAHPVVVELFTSEGCSSCPPADAYLTELTRSRDVLPLAFHVTYWNGLGWRDPFSLEAATTRQQRYGVRFGDGSYTPEMVVDGRKGYVGSDRDAVGAGIERARGEGDSVPLTVRRSADGLAIAVGAGTGHGHLLLVGFDPQHRTAVGRGENRGRTLTESNIVRSVRTIGEWSGEALVLREPLPAGEDQAVLLEAADGRIAGAARAEP